MKKIPWKVFNDEYLILTLMKQIRRKRVSRSLIKEIARRGILDDIVETLEKDRDFYKEFKETIEFIKRVAVSLYVQEALETKYRIPETFTEYPEILTDWLRKDSNVIIDVFEDEQYRYIVKLDRGGIMMELEWKL